MITFVSSFQQGIEVRNILVSYQSNFFVNWFPGSSFQLLIIRRLMGKFGLS